MVSHHVYNGSYCDLPAFRFVCVFRGRAYPAASVHDGCPHPDILCVFNKGVGTIPLILFVEQPYLSDMNTRIGFVFVSSVFSLIIGVLYGIGTLSHGLNGDGTKSHDT